MGKTTKTEECNIQECTGPTGNNTKMRNDMAIGLLFKIGETQIFMIRPDSLRVYFGRYQIRPPQYAWSR